jgi:hypothetical protein
MGLLGLSHGAILWQAFTLYQEMTPPFKNIDYYILAVAQLDQIKNRYNAHKELALGPKKEANSREFAVEECKQFGFLF